MASEVCLWSLLWAACFVAWHDHILRGGTDDQFCNDVLKVYDDVRLRSSVLNLRLATEAHPQLAEAAENKRVGDHKPDGQMVFCWLLISLKLVVSVLWGRMLSL